MNSHCGQNWKELDDDKFGFLKDVCNGTFEVGPSEECDSENEENVCQCLDPEEHVDLPAPIQLFRHRCAR